MMIRYLYRVIATLMLFMASSAGAVEFNQVFDVSAGSISRTANMITHFYVGEDTREPSVIEKELAFIDSELEKAELENTNNAVYWFVRGLHARNKASYYAARKLAVETTLAIEEKNRAYEKSMKLDKENAPHLSATVYAAMKSGLPDRLKQEAIESELNLGGSGENDSYYWYLHWSNINELQKQGRVEDAEKALARMKKELADSESDTSVFNQLAEKAEKDLEKKKEKLDKVADAPSKFEPADPDHKSFTEEDSDNEYYGYLLLVSSLMLVILGVVVLVEINRRKRNK